MKKGERARRKKRQDFALLQKQKAKKPNRTSLSIDGWQEELAAAFEEVEASKQEEVQVSVENAETIAGDLSLSLADLMDANQDIDDQATAMQQQLVSPAPQANRQVMRGEVEVTVDALKAQLMSGLQEPKPMVHDAFAPNFRGAFNTWPKLVSMELDNVPRAARKLHFSRRQA